MRTVYVYENDIEIKKKGQRLEFVFENSVVSSEAIINIDSVVLLGSTRITYPSIKMLLDNGIDIVYANKIGKIIGYTNAYSEYKLKVRLSQYNRYNDYNFRIDFANVIITSKISQQIKIISSNKRHIGETKPFVKMAKAKITSLKDRNDINQIMGTEGAVSAEYFILLGEMIKGMEFKKRDRNPPPDPVNSLLSLTYMITLGKIKTALLAKGLDTGIGFLHEIKNGRPSLALDILELYRPLCDRFVVKTINRGEFQNRDFIIENGRCTLNKNGFSKYIEKYTNNFSPIGHMDRLAEDIKNCIVKGDLTILNENQYLSIL